MTNDDQNLDEANVPESAIAMTARGWPIFAEFTDLYRSVRDALDAWISFAEEQIANGCYWPEPEDDEEW